MEEGATLLTPKKFTVFPGVTKVGQICPTFIRGYPYEPQNPTGLLRGGGGSEALVVKAY